MGVSGGVATGVLASEVCAPLLLLCWLCCWPDDGKSDTSSSGKHPRKPIVAHESGSRRRSNELISRISSSVASLHLPSTSGHSKEPLSAHRSHEEIPSRRKSNLEAQEEEARYHSAPSVIHEILHRRDWERSTKDLYIPLKPEAEFLDNDSDVSNSPEAPHAEPESSSIEGFKSDEKLGASCKKHYTNIKSSRNRTKKESTRDDVKDTDATETSLTNFFIGDTNTETSQIKSENILNNDILSDDKLKSVYKAKDAKQSFNESIKTKDRPKMSLFEDITLGRSVNPLEGYEANTFDIDLDLFVDELDRSGAMHHSVESRSSLFSCISKPGFVPPPSVEAVGYEGGACYLAEAGSLRRVRELVARGGWGGPGEGVEPRARHASDGDILAPTHRPESGAFSESDLDLESGDERPPPYDELQHYVRQDRKETAI